MKQRYQPKHFSNSLVEISARGTRAQRGTVRSSRHQMLGDESFGLVERLSGHISLNIPRCYHEDAGSEIELGSLVSALLQTPG